MVQIFRYRRYQCCPPSYQTLIFFVILVYITKIHLSNILYLLGRYCQQCNQSTCKLKINQCFTIIYHADEPCVDNFLVSKVNHPPQQNSDIFSSNLPLISQSQMWCRLLTNEKFSPFNIKIVVIPPHPHCFVSNSECEKHFLMPVVSKKHDHHQ